MQDLWQSMVYVANAPYFWGSMGFTVATSMFVGALLYDGRIGSLSRGLVTILSYGFLILLVTISRIAPIYGTLLDPKYKIQALAGTATLIIITFFYCLGLAIGVYVFKGKKHKHDF